MAVESVAADPVLDYDGAIARFGGDKQLFVEMAGIMLEDTPKLHAELAKAVAEKNPTAVRSHAHALKGLVAGCGGVRAVRVCQSLEHAGETSDLSRADSLLENLGSEIEQLKSALHQFGV
jgi:HPt (histidine-containing phosphotransfer) domain-containing protein